MQTVRLALFLHVIALLFLSACASHHAAVQTSAPTAEQTPCFNCNGKGRCPYCANGTRECGTCNGSGRVTSGSEERTCPTCSGDGSKTCSQCRGTLNCPSCGGTGITPAYRSPIDRP